MSAYLPVIRIAAALALYLLVAMGSMLLVKSIGGDLRRMERRGQNIMAVLGIVANLVILLGVLALSGLGGGPSWTSFGVGFGQREMLAALATGILTVLLGIGYVQLLGTARVVTVEPVPGRVTAGAWTQLALAAVTLLIVAAQEEALYRGLLSANLASLGTLAVVLLTTAIFTAIHLPTNRSGPAQLTSWVLGGLLLVLVYLISGSIWVAIAVHLATDLTNVLAFNVTGAATLWTFKTPLTAWHRTLFRLGQGAAVLAALVLGFGAHLALPGS